MSKILGIHGAMQSGKSSLCNFLHGHLMYVNGITKHFDLNEEGQLLIDAVYQEDGKEIEAMGEVDIESKDYEFVRYAEQNIWPYVQAYSFADSLKDFLIRIFGLTYEQCYGTEADKNTPTRILWADMAKVVRKAVCQQFAGFRTHNEFLTARESMQIFGTNVCRVMFNDCWAQDCMNAIKINAHSNQLSIVPDVRFRNELDIIQSNGGKVVKLMRNKYEDNHISENDLMSADDSLFDAVIDNRELSLRDKSNQMLTILMNWGWMKGWVK